MMKRLFIVAEGQTEQEFINTVLSPYLQCFDIFAVTPILIRTSRIGRGGHVNAHHLLNTINGLLRESQDPELVVTTFIDFFRIPNNMPGYKESTQERDSEAQINLLEKALCRKIDNPRFFPYIQRHEFETLLFSANCGFEEYCSEVQSRETGRIINSYDNPEDINSSPENNPSKRILNIISDYDKVILGNLIALEIGIDTILDRCPRFAAWVQRIIDVCSSP